MTLQSKVRRGRAQLPNLKHNKEEMMREMSSQIQNGSIRISVLTYLDGSVQRCTRKLVVVLGVDDNLHDVVCVALKYLTAGPFLLPVPQLYQHVI